MAGGQLAEVDTLNLAKKQKDCMQGTEAGVGYLGRKWKYCLSM